MRSHTVEHGLKAVKASIHGHVTASIHQITISMIMFYLDIPTPVRDQESMNRKLPAHEILEMIGVYMT